jgi:hypothetical protein
VQPRSRFQLAQLNIGLPRGPLDGNVMAEFMAALAPVNAAADAAPGFVWRLQTDDGDATGVRAFDDDRLIVNMSVWESLEALREFVYSTRTHLDVMRRRREWFERFVDAYLVLWWVPRGHRPDVAEAEDRLSALRRDGPTAAAFTFRETFPSPDAPGGAGARPVADERPVTDERELCPAG